MVGQNRKRANPFATGNDGPSQKKPSTGSPGTQGQLTSGGQQPSTTALTIANTDTGTIVNSNNARSNNNNNNNNNNRRRKRNRRRGPNPSHCEYPPPCSGPLTYHPPPGTLNPQAPYFFPDPALSSTSYMPSPFPPPHPTPLTLRVSNLESQISHLQSLLFTTHATLLSLASERELRVCDGHLVALESQVNVLETRVHELETKSRNAETSLRDIRCEVEGLKRLRAVGLLPTPVPTPQEERQKAVVVGHRDFVDWLKTLDFSPPDGMRGWAEADVRADEYPLCRLLDGTVYYVRLRCQPDGENEQPQHMGSPLVLSRQERGHNDEDEDDGMRIRESQAGPLRRYRAHVLEIEYRHPEHSFLVSPLAPRYALPLGEVYLYKPASTHTPPQARSTNYVLLMDVTSPTKSLWVAYKYEYRQHSDPQGSKACGVELYGLGPETAFCGGMGLFDMARVADSLDCFRGDSDVGGIGRGRGGVMEGLPQLDVAQMSATMYASAYTAVPVFTYPNLKALGRAIDEGWSRQVCR